MLANFSKIKSPLQNTCRNNYSFQQYYTLDIVKFQSAIKITKIYHCLQILYCLTNIKETNMTKTLARRHDKLIKSGRIDVYSDKKKIIENTQCVKCKSVFINGRWTWKAIKENKKNNSTICPACKRISDNLPAGIITLKGEFLNNHYTEIENLIYNINRLEKNKHPLERIIKILNEDCIATITTTGIHIARRIGEALLQAFSGEYSFQYGKNEKSIRVSWTR
jgi:hypothetical protein